MRAHNRTPTAIGRCIRCPSACSSVPVCPPNPHVTYCAVFCAILSTCMCMSSLYIARRVTHPPSPACDGQSRIMPKPVVKPAPPVDPHILQRADSTLSLNSILFPDTANTSATTKDPTYDLVYTSTPRKRLIQSSQQTKHNRNSMATTTTVAINQTRHDSQWMETTGEIV